MTSPDFLVDLQLDTLPYPLAVMARDELICLLRTEWTATDYNWLEAMRGDYSGQLAITSVVVRRQGMPLATATIHFARLQPEVAVIGNVLTLRQHRDQGLASRVIEVALKLAWDAGCKVCLLGTARNPHNVYMHHDFAWENGMVMRCHFKAADFEQKCFTPGQSAVIRAAHWGDLPGLALLAAQPVATICLDYPRGLLSGRYLAAQRCLSNFPVLWYDTSARGGLLAVLAGPENSRVFGFGSVTLTANGTHPRTATVEFASHDHYAPHLPALLAHLLNDCREREVRQAEAKVAAGDEAKLACLSAAGFTVTARLPAALKLNNGPMDVIQLGRAL
jgi:GNAT superfamily N-acetyltransferase/L-amino acid N-acyltransferase YncA